MDFVNKNHEIHPSIRTRIGCFGKGEEYSPFSGLRHQCPSPAQFWKDAYLWGRDLRDVDVPGGAGIYLSFTAGSLPLFY